MNEDHQDFRDVLDDVLREHDTLNTPAHDTLAPVDPAALDTAVATGLLTLLLPEEHQGLGGEAGLAGVVMESIGYHQVSLPLHGHYLALLVLDPLAEHDAVARVYEQVGAEGSLLTADIGVGSGGERLNGIRALDLDQAQGIVQVVSDDVLFTRATDVHDSAPVHGIDPATRLFQARLTNPGVRIGEMQAADQLFHRANLYLTANYQLGALSRALEETVEYARIRFQFGRSIGSYQAIKHSLATLKVKEATARASLHKAASAMGEPASTDGLLPMVAAQVLVGRVYQEVAQWMLRVHAGIGYTWEHFTHKFYRNAVATQALVGSLSEQRLLIGELLTCPTRIRQ